MNTKYKVRVRLHSYVDVIVDAASEAHALVSAERDARFLGYKAYGLSVVSDKVLHIAKVGYPCIPVPTDWQIYSSMKGSTEANNAIRVAATKLGDYLVKNRAKLNVGFVMSAVKKYITPVYRKYRRFGTGDTEPRDMMAAFVADWVKSLIGDDCDRSLFFNTVAGVV